MHRTTEELSTEILQRVIRMETRMVQLGDHVGANLREKQRIEVEPTPRSVVVYIDAMDVSLSRIIDEVKRSEHWKRVEPTHYVGELATVQIRLGDRTKYESVGMVNIAFD